MNCKYCNTEMKALLTSTYCPNNCGEATSFFKDSFNELPVFPFVSKYPNIINVLVEIQPMKCPVGLLFCLDYKFDDMNRLIRDGGWTEEADEYDNVTMECEYVDKEH